MDLRELMSNISSMRPRGNGNGAAATGPIVEGK
jgi:hypothetical protein